MFKIRKEPSLIFLLPISEIQVDRGSSWKHYLHCKITYSKIKKSKPVFSYLKFGKVICLFSLSLFLFVFSFPNKCVFMENIFMCGGAINLWTCVCSCH